MPKDIYELPCGVILGDEHCEARKSYSNLGLVLIQRGMENTVQNNGKLSNADIDKIMEENNYFFLIRGLLESTFQYLEIWIERTQLESTLKMEIFDLKFPKNSP